MTSDRQNQGIASEIDEALGTLLKTRGNISELRRTISIDRLLENNGRDLIVVSKNFPFTGKMTFCPNICQ
jgi:hypothetical protein